MLLLDGHTDGPPDRLQLLLSWNFFSEKLLQVLV
jgi:hypothetical protein